MSKKPTRSRRERLFLLIEECTNVISACNKTLLRGYDFQDPEIGANNHENLTDQLGGLEWVIQLMLEAGDLDQSEIESIAKGKFEHPPEFLRFQRKLLGS